VAGVQRLRGIHEVAAETGLEIAGGALCPVWQAVAGYEATRGLLARHRPRALICMNDELAFGALRALGETGLGVPGDVSIVSFDDEPVASWTAPRLTTIALPHYQLGRAAIELLLAAAEQQERPGQQVVAVPMPLRRRESVGPPAP
jgi:LacI family transcriptional regulator